MSPKISIIVPVYNVEKYLEQCIESLIHQTYENIEIICVNDGSTDRSREILKHYAEKDARVVVIDKENSGVSDTRNTGLSYINGQYVMFLDSDDWIDAETCQVTIEKIEKYHADVVLWNYIREFETASKEKIIFGKEDIIFDNENVKELHRRFVGLYEEELSRPENADSIVPVWGKLYRANIIVESKTQFIDTKIVGTSEDALFNLQVFGCVKRAVYLSDCFNHYRKENITSFTKNYKKDLQKQWANLFDYIEKYIIEENCDNTFKIALDNRKSLSIIGLGMNILRDSNSSKCLGRIKQIINSSDYRAAVKNLKLKYFPLHWKVFFGMAKYNCAWGVYLMLVCINKLKGN